MKTVFKLSKQCHECMFAPSENLNGKQNNKFETQMWSRTFCIDLVKNRCFLSVFLMWKVLFVGMITCVAL